MPQYSTPLEEIDESVIRPVILSVTTDLLERMELPTSLPILFKGDSAQHFYRGSELEHRYNDTFNGNRFEGDSILYLETTIEDTDFTLLSTTVYRPEEKPLFVDPKLSVVMKPGVVSKKVDINFTITGTEKETERWRSTLRRKTAKGAIGLTHMVTYHYPIPVKYMYLLTEIFNMRQANHGYPDETLFGYFEKHFIRPYTAITNQAGNGTLFTVQEKQLPIQGWFEFGTNPPKPEKQNDVSSYSLNFTYSFYFDCPETIAIKCPLVIHNQILPHHFLNVKYPLEVDYIEKHGAWSQENFNTFRFSAENQSNRTKPIGIPGLPIPWFDDWLDYFNPQWYQSLIRVMVQVDENNPNFILNLKELGAWEINPLMLNYIMETRGDLWRPYDNLLSLSLWRWGNLEDMRNLYIDDDFNVYSKIPLNPRDNYHLMLSICYDPTMLTDYALDYLLDHTCFLKHYLTILNPDITKKYDWDLKACAANPDKFKDRDVLSKHDWKKIIDDFSKGGTPFYNDPDVVIWHLVAGFTIVAHRMNELD